MSRAGASTLLTMRSAAAVLLALLLAAACGRVAVGHGIVAMGSRALQQQQLQQQLATVGAAGTSAAAMSKCLRTKLPAILSRQGRSFACAAAPSGCCPTHPHAPCGAAAAAACRSRLWPF
jgi:hypothetical protein